MIDVGTKLANVTDTSLHVLVVVVRARGADEGGGYWLVLSDGSSVGVADLSTAPAGWSVYA